MKTRPQWIGVAFLLALLVDLSHGAVDCTKPIDLANSNRGACGREELETDCGCVQLPRLKRRIEPRYPSDARKRNLAGKVVLIGVVEKDGSVGGIQVASAEPEGQGFEEPAVEVFGKWRYWPARISKHPVAVFITAEMNFRITGRDP